MYTFADSRYMNKLRKKLTYFESVSLKLKLEFKEEKQKNIY